MSKKTPEQFFITGIGTDVGKTVVSAIVSEALEASYWKPIQAGDLDNSDSIKVEKWTQNVTVLPERYRLISPMSPHAAARIDGVEIDLNSFELPEVNGNLIVEGAGGLMVPINDKELILDLIKSLGLKTILVVRNYLGSINHTLLSIDLLKAHGVEIEGLIYSGEANVESENFIATYSGLPTLARILWGTEVNAQFVQEQATTLRESAWYKKL